MHDATAAPATMSSMGVREPAAVGLEMFGLVAGVGADVFLPKEYTDAIGTSETRLVYQGRLYITQPLTDVGLMFSVTPAADQPEPTK